MARELDSQGFREFLDAGCDTALMEADADLERVLVIDDRDTPLTLADERIARAIRENNARLVIIDVVDGRICSEECSPQ